MRSSISRAAFRGASRLVPSTAPRGSSLSRRRTIRPREFCSTTAITSGTFRQTEDLGNTSDVKSSDIVATSSPPVPEIGVITNAAEISPAAEIENTHGSDVTSEDIYSEASFDDATPSALTHARTDPKAFRNLLSETLQRKAIRSALWYFSTAMKIPDQPGIDEEVLKIVLPLLGRYGWAPSSLEALVLAAERGYNLGIGYYNCGLHAVSRSGNTAEFSQLLDAMWKLPKESHPNATSYTYLIGAHIYRSATDDAFEVLNEMKTHLIYPTFATYHALITGCLKRRDSQRAYSTLLAVEKQRFEISAMTVSQVLVAAAQNDDFDEVLGLISKLEDSLPRYNNELHRIAETRAVYKIAAEERTTKEERAELRGDPKPELGIIAEILLCAFRGGRADVATAGWRMLKLYYPDVVVSPSLWYCMVGAFARGGDFSNAFAVVGTMREAGIPLCLKDLETGLIRPLSDDVAKVDEQFFRLVDMFEGTQTGMPSSEDHSIENAPLVSSDIDSLDPLNGEITPSTSHDAEEPPSDVQEELNVDDAQELHPSPDEKAPAQESLGDVLSAPDNLGIESDLGFSPKSVGIDELNCIIAACSHAKDLDRAFQTYDEVESRFGLQRNADTFNALLEGCVQVRHTRGGLRILHEMEKIGLKINGTAIHLGARLLLRARRLQDAIDMIEKARSEGSTVSVRTYQMLLRNCVRGEMLDEAQIVYERALASGYDRRSMVGRLGHDDMRTLDDILDSSQTHGDTTMSTEDTTIPTEDSGRVDDSVDAEDGKMGGESTTGADGDDSTISDNEHENGSGKE